MSEDITKRKRGRPKVSKDVINTIPAMKPIPTSFNKRENNNVVGNNWFKKGNKASNGRPKGSRNKSTLMLDALGMDNVVAVYQKLIDLALGRTKEGDVTSCKIILDRVYPVQKYRRIDLGFEGPLDTIQDINALSKYVTRMAIDGEISFDEAEEGGKVLEQRMKSITDSDVMSKIESTCKKVEEIKNGR